mmetsp:Transcript_49022/g.79566  ORF Transcript_49022/g.79566 Transcript_49022/m.79566 type:complete len:528 (-) Transcript_49022:49-1632(-)
MKLLVQRVTRATAEVNGLVESRIGTGLVLLIGLRAGDSQVDVDRLASKVVQLNLWPDQVLPGEESDGFDGEKADRQWRSNVVDNGFEVLVLLQQSLCATFPGLQPCEDGAMDPMSAQLVLEGFVKKLRAEYQDEMVVLAPMGADLRLEITAEGACLFDLSSMVAESRSAGKRVGADVGAKTRKPVGGNGASSDQLEPDVATVTKLLRRMAGLPRSKRTLESCRVFKVFSMKRFRDSLSEASQAMADAFAEALDAAAPYFTEKQQEQITTWTGITVAATPVDQAGDEEDEIPQEAALEEQGDELEEQLAELREEVTDPKAAAARKVHRAMAVKKEAAFYEDARRPQYGQKAGAPSTYQTAMTRPDWKGRAAPNTPTAIAARDWAARRGAFKPWAPPQQAQPEWMQSKGVGKGKMGKGKRPQRSWGIVSLDESARMHGTSGQDFEYRQHTRYDESRLRLQQAKEEERDLGPEESSADGWGCASVAETEEAAGRGVKRKAAAPQIRLPKGTPTVAPMTPAASKDVSVDDL